MVKKKKKTDRIINDWMDLRMLLIKHAFEFRKAPQQKQNKMFI